MFNLTNEIKQYTILLKSFSMYSSINFLSVFLLLILRNSSALDWSGSFFVSDDQKSSIDRLPNILL